MTVSLIKPEDEVEQPAEKSRRDALLGLLDRIPEGPLMAPMFLGPPGAVLALVIYWRYGS